MSGLLNKLTHHGQQNQGAHNNQGLAPGQPGYQQTTITQTTCQCQPACQPGQCRLHMGQQSTTVVDAPIIQETVRQDRVIEVQPVIHREVDKNIVHHIEKHIQEAPAPNMGGVVERPAVVQQQVVTNVINEIQPVIHRERAVPIVEHTEQHLAQRIVEPTIHTHEVVYESYQQQGIQQQGLQQQQFQQQQHFQQQQGLQQGQQFQPGMQQGMQQQPGLASGGITQQTTYSQTTCQCQPQCQNGQCLRLQQQQPGMMAGQAGLQKPGYQQQPLAGQQQAGMQAGGLPQQQQQQRF